MGNLSFAVPQSHGHLDASGFFCGGKEILPVLPTRIVICQEFKSRMRSCLVHPLGWIKARDQVAGEITLSEALARRHMAPSTFIPNCMESDFRTSRSEL